ncbi:coproporphyrinogen-III oxidase family protein [Opitutales bacterium]|jgi:oxygen-independent coproporphyrinogen-3 oxidase|uniref:coproporphyrinogen-III oxidase family protein n=1 Tax=Candidatus Seribacter sulfatis TaxID=3381756 RepID=UPI002A0B0195|nr:coproporphyrinogen-III oxidase family protein [Opitutales bacterium]
MSDSTFIKPDYQTEDETKAGNYFVSNYPPFSFWNDEDVPCVNSMINSPSQGTAPLGIYYHVPFCRKRCHFCYFKVYTDKNSNDVRRYLSATIEELRTYSESPYLQGRKPKFVYFGGGTPSYLSAQQLTELTDQMKAILPWDEAEEVTFECEPGTLSEKKLSVIKEFGVTRLSLGVENFNDHILGINGRAHRSKEVFRAYEFARGLGFDNINIDLIAGMLEETDENWSDCVDQVVDLSPDCVTIYQMEVPFNTGIFKNMKEEGKLSAPVADWPTKRRWVAEAYEKLEKAGYTITSAYTAVKNPETTKFIYRDRLWSGADMVGLGVSSFGHLGGIHYQNITNIDHYCDSVEAKKAPVRRALMTQEEERFIRELILQWKLGRVDKKYFQKKFGISVTERFSLIITKWKENGDLIEEGDYLVLIRDALLRVDSLLHQFFLPHHQDARYV